MDDPNKAIENMNIDMEGLRPDHQQFIKNLAEGDSQGVAYAKSKGRKKVTNSDYASASRLLKTAKVSKVVTDMTKIYKNMSEWAFKEQIKLSQDSKTPPAVKNAIYKEIQDRAGHNATQKIETTKKIKYPEFDLSPEQLHEVIEEAKRPNSDMDANASMESVGVAVDKQ